MIEINLVPNVKQELIKVQRVRVTVIAFSILIGLVSVAIVALLLFYVFAVQGIRGTVADGDIKKGSDQLSSVQDLSKTLTIQNQLTKISGQHDNKKIDSRIFDVLTAIIPPAPNLVMISNLSVDSTTGSITLEGQAANSYAAVEVFRKTIEGAKIEFTTDGTKTKIDLAKDISTGETSYGEDTSGMKVLRFKMSFNYAPELFAPSSKGIVITLSNRGNVTDSYLGVPKSIFVDRATDIKGAQ